MPDPQLSGSTPMVARSHAAWGRHALALLLNDHQPALDRVGEIDRLQLLQPRTIAVGRHRPPRPGVFVEGSGEHFCGGGNIGGSRLTHGNHHDANLPRFDGFADTVDAHSQ